MIGFSINTLTLFGIVLATGLVVDDAIVVIENIQRHMGEEHVDSHFAASEAMDDARESVSEALQSLELNLTNIRRGAGLPGATRPIEVLQPIQALAQARADYLLAVLAYNRAQFGLLRAIGQAPLLPAGGGQPPQSSGNPSRGG